MSISGWLPAFNSSFLLQSGDLRIRLISDSKLSVIVSVSADGCLLPCAGSVMNWNLVQAVTFDPEGAISSGGRGCASWWMH